MNSEAAAIAPSPAGDLSWPLQRAKRIYGSAEAICCDQRRLTYGQLADRVGGLGAALAEIGVPVGGRIGFLGGNSLAHVESWLGIPAFGRVMVDLNFRLAEVELAFMVDDCGLEVLIIDQHQLEVGRTLRAKCASLRELVLCGSESCPGDCIRYEELVNRAPAPAIDVEPHSIAAISYTGGTTGTPKGVMLSHANLLANARHNLMATGHTSADRWLHVCPMFHVAGTANVLACTWVGAAQVVLPRFAARSVAETIAREGITHTLLVPTMLGMLLEQLADQPCDLSSLRHVQYAATPISPKLQRRVLEQFDCEIAQFYGMTEAAPTVSQLTPEDHRRGFRAEEPYRSRMTSVGAPIVGVQTEVRGEDGSRTPPGEIGELWVRGPNVMLGYWNQPAASRAALIDGWYRTGDAVYADHDGYLYLVDRLKDMIITGGENVYSLEVESALVGHEAIVEAAVFGTPHARWGEAVHAVVAVVPESSLTSAELIEHCRSRIAGYKVPRTIDIQSDPLPRSGAGKVAKNLLREPFWVGHERRIS